MKRTAIAERYGVWMKADSSLSVVADCAPRTVPKPLLCAENGQTFGEYSLILALVVVIAAAGLSSFGTNLGNYMTSTVAAVIAMLVS